jgi:hypothetical protein
MRLSLRTVILTLLPVALGTAQELRPLAGAVRSTNRDSLKPAAVQLTGYEYSIPELIIGGEWTSTIKLTNQGTSTTPSTNVYFYDDQGFPLKASYQTSGGKVITDVGFNFSLPPGTVLETTFIGGSSTQFGHAVIDCNSGNCSMPGFYGDVTLRNRNSSRPDFESIFPFETPASLQYMLFDGRKGFTTTLYLVNESSNSTNISIDVVDSTDALLRTVVIPFSGLQSQILTLHSIAPESVGVLGSLTIRTPSSKVVVTATGLRLTPSNSFTPLRAFVPVQ